MSLTTSLGDVTSLMSHQIFKHTESAQTYRELAVRLQGAMAIAATGGGNVPTHQPARRDVTKVPSKLQTHRELCLFNGQWRLLQIRCMHTHFNCRLFRWQRDFPQSKGIFRVPVEDVLFGFLLAKWLVQSPPPGGPPGGRGRDLCSVPGVTSWVPHRHPRSDLRSVSFMGRTRKCS